MEITITGIIVIIAIVAILFGAEKLLKLYINRCVKKMEKKFDKVMEEMEEWSKEEGGDAL
jgi:Sec-independent protein translocase protein TatA